MTMPIEHDRVAQLLMKADPSKGFDAARIQLERASLIISAGAAAATPWGQAALLTIAECASRSFRGGVFLQGEFAEPVCVGNYAPFPLRHYLCQTGCRANVPSPDHAVHIHVGAEKGSKAKLVCWTDGWIAAVGPTGPSAAVTLGNELSGAMAGSMAVIEAFRMTALGDLVAGKRTLRTSPLAPHAPKANGISLELLPSSMHLLGLGNLGQGLLWVLGLLPYSDPAAVQIVLQDMDKSGPENLDVQILTRPDWIGHRKARNAGRWCDDRGFVSVLNELSFGPQSIRDPEAPGLAFIGVDNIPARLHAARPEAGFDLVIDAGLGASPTEVFDIRIHGFPGSRDPSAAWRPDEVQAPGVADPVQLSGDWQKLVNQGRLDKCGAITIAGQPVGMPATAVAAATIQVAQACRAIQDRRYSDLVDISLTNPSRAVVTDAPFANARLLLFQEARLWQKR